jgi:hypothetical protein
VGLRAGRALFARTVNRCFVTALDQRTHPAWTRLKFDELLAQQLSLKAHRRARARRKAPRLPGDNSLTSVLSERLPFTLTKAQARVIGEMRRDLARSEPMQRLLQGDVGSGKTIVAALAALQAIDLVAFIRRRSGRNTIANSRHGSTVCRRRLVFRWIAGKERAGPRRDPERRSFAAIERTFFRA